WSQMRDDMYAQFRDILAELDQFARLDRLARVRQAIVGGIFSAATPLAVNMRATNIVLENLSLIVATYRAQGLAFTQDFVIKMLMAVRSCPPNPSDKVTGLLANLPYLTGELEFPTDYATFSAIRKAEAAKRK